MIILVERSEDDHFALHGSADGVTFEPLGQAVTRVLELAGLDLATLTDGQSLTVTIVGG